MIQVDLLIVAPAVGALIALVIGRSSGGFAKWAALASIGAQIGLLLALGSQGVFSGQRIMGLDGGVTRGAWQTVVDGLSLPLVLLTVFIGLVAVIASWKLEERPGSYFALILALQAALTGVFLAESLILFYVAWECVLIPMFFLIGGWGSSNRKHAASKFLIYTFAAGAVMLLGVILALVWTGGATSIGAISQSGVPLPVQATVFWLFMAGFLVKLPAVPFHTWLPDAHTEAPTAGSIILAGVMLKMGGYGIIRIALPFAPAAFGEARFILAILGVVGIIYGAAMALVQTDLKRLVAYSSVAHMGFVLLGVAAGTTAGLGAAMLVMVSHGFVAGLLFLLVGTVYERTHTRELGRMGGFGSVVPMWSVAFVFGSLASLGLPGLSGFPGELVSVIEGFSAFGWWTTAATVGLVLGAAYNLRAVRGTVQGPVGEFAVLPDLTVRESALVLAFATGIVVLGVRPVLVLGVAEQALSGIAAIVGGGV
ncbi:MAG: NADH-quinone oxidoreductase subunit M [Coriobacteriia bacterium]|nr:NADH-quinone oxidoreductase subunit M [Coriobacteriia bacterium]